VEARRHGEKQKIGRGMNAKSTNRKSKRVAADSRRKAQIEEISYLIR
jgi:hypothetical protein